jgi:hypothetical protein
MQLTTLIEYFKIMDSLFRGLTREDFMKLAHDFAEKECPSLPFQNCDAGVISFLGEIQV